VVTLNENKNKALNTNKEVQFLDVINNLKKFIIKDKKTTEYFPSQIINKVNNNQFNDMINKKKDDLSRTMNSNDFDGIEFF
jgi:hypothetical protein